MTDLACRVKALSVQHMFSFLHNLVPSTQTVWLLVVASLTHCICKTVLPVAVRSVYRLHLDKNYTMSTLGNKSLYNYYDYYYYTDIRLSATNSYRHLIQAYNQTWMLSSRIST